MRLLKISIGQKFGEWTVLGFLSKKEALAAGHKGGSAYLCECSCPKKTKRYKNSAVLLKGISMSCGCQRWENNKTNSMAKYGIEVAATRPEVLKRREQTIMKKYNVKNTFQSNALMANARSNMDYAAAREKATKTCLTKYGVPSTLSKGMPDRVPYRTTSKDVAKGIETKKKLGALNVLPNGMSVSEFCKVHKVNSQHANSIYREMGSEACEQYILNKETDKTSYLERHFMRAMQPEVSLSFYNKECEVGGKTHRPDFIYSDKLHINVDGVMWHSEKYKDNLYHFEKREAYERDGMQLLQLRSDEVFGKLEIVKSIIKHKCGISDNKVYARKTEVREIEFKTASAFLTASHLMGSGPNGRAIGLFSDNALVAVLTYKISNDELEILRYSTALNTSVIGGLSKLIKHLIRQNSSTVKKIISFVDLRYGTGASLEKIGFTRTGVNLGWMWVDKYSKTQNRLRCRASDTESEATIAAKLNYTKIYDAGQAKYVLKVT